jgi:hypothetical protein
VVCQVFGPSLASAAMADVAAEAAFESALWVAVSEASKFPEEAGARRLFVVPGIGSEAFAAAALRRGCQLLRHVGLEVRIVINSASIHPAWRLLEQDFGPDAPPQKLTPKNEQIQDVVDACAMSSDTRDEAMVPGECDLDPDAYDPPGPIIQVGECRFCLPAPDIAVQRVADLWRPGAVMTVVTTEHYGTPLLCPEGDVARGLVNLAPASETDPQEMVPLFWQNVQEFELSRALGDLELDAGLSLGRTSAVSRGPRLQSVLEEDEEDEEEEADVPVGEDYG